MNADGCDDASILVNGLYQTVPLYLVGPVHFPSLPSSPPPPQVSPHIKGGGVFYEGGDVNICVSLK